MYEEIGKTEDEEVFGKYRMLTKTTLKKILNLFRTSRFEVSRETSLCVGGGDYPVTGPGDGEPRPFTLLVLRC